MENKKEIKLAIVGSRTFDDLNKFHKIIQILKNNYTFSLIVSGGAKGADSMGEKYADDNNIPKLILKADWKKFGKRAGFIRNVDIIKNCDLCVAFWDGNSHGTKHDIKLCKEMNKPCIVYNYITGILSKEN